MKRVIVKGKSEIRIWLLLIALNTIAVIIAVLVEGLLFSGYFVTTYISVLVLGIPVVIHILYKLYFLFFVYENEILVKYPLRVRKNRMEIIPLNNVRMVELWNNLRGANVLYIHPIRGTIKTNKIYFWDLLNRNVYVFLKHIHNKGIEIDMSNSVAVEKQWRRIEKAKL